MLVSRTAARAIAAFTPFMGPSHVASTLGYYLTILYLYSYWLWHTVPGNQISGHERHVHEGHTESWKELFEPPRAWLYNSQHPHPVAAVAAGLTLTALEDRASKNQGKHTGHIITPGSGLQRQVHARYKHIAIISKNWRWSLALHGWTKHLYLYVGRFDSPCHLVHSLICSARS